MRIPSRRAFVSTVIFLLSICFSHLNKAVNSWLLPSVLFKNCRVDTTTTTTLAARTPLRKPIRRKSSSTSAPGSNSAQTQEQQLAEAQKRHEGAFQDPTLLSNTTFDDPLLALDAPILRAVTQTLGLQRLTEIQAKTWPAAVTGQSLLGRSQTGSGKTVSFLLPAIQRLVQATDPTFHRPGRTLGLLVVAPTRELALQIADQARALLTFQQPAEAWSVQCLYGGTKIGRDRAVLARQQATPAIIVATPGRLLDLLEQKTRCNSGKRLLADILGETPIVVLDEADRLLEAFQRETQKILSFLPRKRQTILFSATFPKRLLRGDDDGHVLPANHTIIDCIGRNAKDKKSDAAQRNLRIEESYVQLSDMNHYLTGLVSIVREAVEGSDPEYPKLLIFFPTAKLVKFAAEMFATCNVVDTSSTSVLQIHSRMSQAARNRASAQFRQSKRAILLTSDVSARGIDYPDISLVVQYGSPYNTDLYLHRLGRTGRLSRTGGAKGNGLIVLLPFESAFESFLKKRQVPKSTSGFDGLNKKDSVIQEKMVGLKQRVQSKHPVLCPSAEAAYKSFIAHYLEYGAKSVSGPDVAEAARGLAVAMGLKDIPTLPEEITTQLK